MIRIFQGYRIFVSTLAFAGALLAGALGFALPVSAQGLEPLEEITVRARATEQAIRDIPTAITAVNEETIDKYGFKDLRDIAAFTPGMEMFRTNSGAGVQISVRGISSSAQTIGIESSVALIFDGVYFAQSRTIFEGLIDTSQVAILKGPQALYFGKNATAGVISVSTNDPGDELEILGKIGYEIEAQEIAGELVFSTPINEKWGIRLAIAASDMNQGYVKNTAGPSTYTTFDAAQGVQAFELFGFPQVNDNPAPKSGFSPGEEFLYTRLTLKGTPSDSFTWRLKGSYADASANNNNIAERQDCFALAGLPHATSPAPSASPNQFPIDVSMPGNECLVDRAAGQNPIPPTLAESTPDLGRFGGELGEAYKSYVVTGDFEFDLENVNIQTVLNWHQQRVGWVIDADGGGATAVMASEFSVFDAYSAEVRAATKFDGGINGVLGFYYQKTKRDWRQEVIFAGAQNTAVVDPADEFIAYDKTSQTDGQTISIYAELIWDITDQWELTAGVRYIDEKKDSVFTQPYVNPFFKGRTGPDFTFGPDDGPAPLFVEGRFLEDDRSFDDWIPEVTLRWQPNDDTTVWIAYKQGFKSGGFDNGSIDSTLNADAIGDITYDPETVEGGEAGIKMLLADGALSLEFDIFYYKYSDLQLNFFNASTFAFRTFNAGSAKTKGAELQVNWAPDNIEGLRINGSLAFNNANYVKFAAPCFAGQRPEQGCTFDPTLALQEQNLDGGKRDFAPKWAGSVGFDYAMPFGNGLEWGVSPNLRYKSKYLPNSFIQDRFQGGYFWLDAALRFGDIDGTWQFSIIGRNLTDKYVLVRIIDVPSTGGNQGLPNGFNADRQGTPLNPRTIEFELSFRF